MFASIIENSLTTIKVCRITNGSPVHNPLSDLENAQSWWFRRNQRTLNYPHHTTANNDMILMDNRPTRAIRWQFCSEHTSIKMLTAIQTNTSNFNRAHTTEITSWTAIKAGGTEQNVTLWPSDLPPSAYDINLTTEQLNGLSWVERGSWKTQVENSLASYQPCEF